jgi:hypothetical protein
VESVTAPTIPALIDRGWDVFEYLLALFREGSGAEQWLEGAEQMLPIPLPRGSAAGRDPV